MIRDLIICGSPLQMIVAEKIIDSGVFSDAKPDIIIVALSESPAYHHYLNKLKGKSNKSYYFRRGFNIHSACLCPIIFARKTYRDVYIAGINVGLFHFLLSFIKFRSIKTFDDGTANIFLDSPYFIDPKGAFHKVKRLVYWVMGNRYSRSRLINDSLIHYSIYPGYKNIIDNVVYLDKGQGLNKEILQKKGHKRRKAFLLLGACYDKIVNRPQDIELIINKLIFYVDKITDCEFFYLPHPVENLEIFNPSGYSICDTSMVAEDLIHKINNIYDEIMVAGFASSAQFGLAGFCNIKNIVLISNHMRPGVLNLCYMLASKDAELYSLDE